MAQKTLQERVRETIYPNGVGAITAEKEQALLIDFANVIDTKLGKDGVDAEFSTTSENPVQNKVITTALNKKADKTYVDEKIGDASTEEVYVGESEPTDEKVKVWINPNEVATTYQTRAASGVETGSGQISFYSGVPSADGMMDLTEEEKEHNAKVFQIIKNSPIALHAYVDISRFYIEIGGSEYGVDFTGFKSSKFTDLTQYLPASAASVLILREKEVVVVDGLYFYSDGSAELPSE